MIFKRHYQLVDNHVPHPVVADLTCVLPGYAAVGEGVVRRLAHGANLAGGLGGADAEVRKGGEDYAQPEGKVQEVYLVGGKRVAKHEHADEDNHKRPHRNGVRGFKPRDQLFVLLLFDLLIKKHYELLMVIMTLKRAFLRDPPGTEGKSCRASLTESPVSILCVCSCYLPFSLSN